MTEHKPGSMIGPDGEVQLALADHCVPGNIVIHAFSVGGGILAISPMPGRGGDYAGDLAHIRSWEPALVVTLVTSDELVAKDAASLGAHIQDGGTRWVHLPITDFQAPDAEARGQWPSLSVQIRRALAGGGRVLIHCMGGRGRSGMAALRLMIEAGEDADLALTRLRAINPLAVETEDQLFWARAARATPLAKPATSVS